MLIIRCALFFFLTLSCVNASDDNWWNSNWSHRARITLRYPIKNIEKNKNNNIQKNGISLRSNSMEPEKIGKLSSAEAIVYTTEKKSDSIRVIINGTAVDFYASQELQKGTWRIVFPLPSEPNSTIFVYWGNDKAKRQSVWTPPKDGLRLAIFKMGRPLRAPGNWYDMKKIIKRSVHREGERAWSRINDHSNPFGSIDYYVSRYTGFVLCEKKGKYSWAIDCDDAGFVLINGRLVAQWAGRHKTIDSWKHSGSIELDAGVHYIEVHHLDLTGAQAVRVAWKTPNSQGFTLMPSDAFVDNLPTNIFTYEQKVKDEIVSTNALPMKVISEYELPNGITMLYGKTPNLTKIEGEGAFSFNGAWLLKENTATNVYSTEPARRIVKLQRSTLPRHNKYEWSMEKGIRFFYKTEKIDTHSNVKLLSNSDASFILSRDNETYPLQIKGLSNLQTKLNSAFPLNSENARIENLALGINVSSENKFLLEKRTHLIVDNKSPYLKEALSKESYLATIILEYEKQGDYRKWLPLRLWDQNQKEITAIRLFSNTASSNQRIKSFVWGDSATSAYITLAKQKLSLETDVVIIAPPIFSDTSVFKFTRIIDAMIDKARPAKIVLVTPEKNKIDSNISSPYADAIKQLAVSHHLEVLDKHNNENLSIDDLY